VTSSATSAFSSEMQQSTLRALRDGLSVPWMPTAPPIVFRPAEALEPLEGAASGRRRLAGAIMRS